MLAINRLVIGILGKLLTQTLIKAIHGGERTYLPYKEATYLITMEYYLFNSAADLWHFGILATKIK